MDKQPNKTLSPREPNTWVPYFVAMAGSLIVILIWQFFIIQIYSFDFITQSLVPSFPWILLVIGVSTAIIAGIAIHLTQVTREREAALLLVDEKHQKEIVERLRTEETKQKLEIALLQGQKLQAIGTLAGGIAHDFNNILYAIIGYVEIAREDVEKESLVYKNLGKVLEAAQRGQDLVTRILTFGRRHASYEMKPIRIKTMLESVLALLHSTIPSSVVIELVDIKADTIILGNQNQLHQVIVNIINNAVDAMDGEGQITIQVSKVFAKDNYIRQFPDIRTGNYCKIDITDTGQGMDQVTKERIFEPFFTTKEVGKGTGLGLATVHATIKEHAGAITVTSTQGIGTTFTLLLPEYAPITEKQGELHGNYITC